MTSAFPQSLKGLLSAAAYPHAVETVELIETHVSWVLLAGAFAYKIKRPVCYAFVDMRKAERRQFYCEEELRLNRRFAPELYLDVRKIVVSDGEARIGTEGEVIEHAVRMHRFNRADELDRLLEGGRIEPRELEEFGRDFAAIHARLPVAAPQEPWGRPAEVQALITRNLSECADAAAVFGRSQEILALREAMQARLTAAASWLVERHANGRIRECHGDLHTRNIVRISARLLAFDCMEFEPAFRWIDVADDVAFLLSDLIVRDRSLHAHAFRGGYFSQSGDFHACRFLDLYQAHRVLVRAKVASLSAKNLSRGPIWDSLKHEHERLVGAAATFLTVRKPLLLLMCGLSGSGKTWLARPLAVHLDALHLRSDVERKRRSGLGELARSGAAIAAGIYSKEASVLVYEDLARAAEDILLGGYTVVVDATFSRRSERGHFKGLAERLSVRPCVVHCRAPLSVLRARIGARQKDRRDASEANEPVLDWQITTFEAVTLEEGFEVIDVDTSDADALAKVLRRIEGAPQPC